MSETRDPTSRVWTVPNALSMLRLLGVPLFVWLLLAITTVWVSSSS